MGVLEAVRAVGTVVSVRLELEVMVGVDDAVVQLGTIVCVSVIVIAGVLAVVVHEGTTV